jgi:hypothetical protein
MCLKGLKDMIIETSRRKRPVSVYTKALLHFDGEDGSKIFIDETGKEWNNTATLSYTSLDTGYKKFGASSLLSASTNSSGALYTPSTEDFAFGSDDFTVDYWTLSKNTYNRHRLVFGNTYTDWLYFLYIYADGSAGLYIYYKVKTSSTPTAIISLSDFTVDNWNHIAIVFSGGNTQKFFVNGILQDTSNFNYNIPDSSCQIMSGDNNSSRWDEFRVSKGISRWTSNFTPPTEPYILD